MLPLITLLGATASGKTALSIALAQRFGGEILSCDSVAVYRHMEVGTAKPTAEQRALVPHHLLDRFTPDEPCTAGDYARLAREVLAVLTQRTPTPALPIVVGGTGFYLRALLDGLFAAPVLEDSARRQLRQHLHEQAALHGPNHLHATLLRLDPRAAEAIHPNDLPKLVRAIEIATLAEQPITALWERGRDALTGYRILRLGLDPPRPELYARIDRRAADMFQHGLVEETRVLIARFGADARPLTSLGYAEAAAVLRHEIPLHAAIHSAQQGHRNYAKRQMTWFRREAKLHTVHWLHGTGDDPAIVAQALALVEAHLAAAL